MRFVGQRGTAAAIDIAEACVRAAGGEPLPPGGRVGWRNVAVADRRGAWRAGIGD